MFWVRLSYLLLAFALTSPPADRTIHLPGIMGGPSPSGVRETEFLVRIPVAGVRHLIEHSGNGDRFVPIVILALVFNGSNAVGFTYAYVLALFFYIEHLVLNHPTEIEMRSNAGQTPRLGASTLVSETSEDSCSRAR